MGYKNKKGKGYIKYVTGKKISTSYAVYMILS